MLRRVVLQLRSRNDLQAAALAHGATLSVADCRPMDRDTMVMLLDIEGSTEERKGTINALQKMHGIRRVHRVEDARTKSSVLAVVDKPSVCRTSEKSAILCLDCPFDSTEMPARWEFIAKSQDDVWKLMVKLKQEGVDALPKGITVLDPKSARGNEERAVIALATEWGFFDYPRKITLKELSRLAKVSPAKVRTIVEGADTLQ